MAGGATAGTIRRREHGVEQGVWTCPNCAVRTAAARKRCRDCGTSRY